MDIVKHNSTAWDKASKTNLAQWTNPVSTQVIKNARNGISQVLLTDTKFVPEEWYMPVKGKNILCLACGGGQQAPVFSAMGANVTVIDISESQLNGDRMVAKRENLTIKIINNDMCDLSIFSDESFDMIFHPISNCYIPNPNIVWKECYRVLKKGGTLLSGFVNPLLYIFDVDAFDNNILKVSNSIPYSDLEQLPKEQLNERIANNDTLEFGHTLDTLIGGQINVGFALTGFYEDICNNELLDKHINSRIATRAVKL